MLIADRVYGHTDLLGRVVVFKDSSYYVDTMNNVTVIPDSLVAHMEETRAIKRNSEVFELPLLNIDTTRLQLSKTDTVYKALYRQQNDDGEFITGDSSGSFYIIKKYFVEEAPAGKYIIVGNERLPMLEIVTARKSITCIREIPYDEMKWASYIPFSTLTLAWRTQDNFSFEGLTVYAINV